jgi:hypothetical protein
MKRFNSFIFSIISILFVLNACSDENNNSTNPDKEQFTSLSSPYLVCANRNPGGVGFDFVYMNDEGGANNMDSLSVMDFAYDVKIRTIKGEKPDGSLGGMPYFKLSESTSAVNFSEIDNEYTGYSKFLELTLDDISDVIFNKDDASFDLSKLEKGSSGSYLISDIQKEYKKLVIGDKWRSSANNDIENDEIIWVIKTNEGLYVKLIVTDFPANPAPTATGYIAIEWELMK